MGWLWAGFIVFVLLMLALDLGVFHRHAHVVTVQEALVWSAVWATLGLSFSVFVYYGYENQWLRLGSTIDAVDGVINDGTTATIKYLTGYVVEKSLSVDNIFVIAMLFGFFAVPALYQHRVLLWGILGALLMRGAMIALGATLIAEFHWLLYLFGVFLLVTGLKMLILKTDHADPRSCTSCLRIIPLASKPGKMPPSPPVLEGAMPWSRIFFTTNSPYAFSCGSSSCCTSLGPSQVCLLHPCRRSPSATAPMHPNRLRA